jgi:hypothetical protein
VRTVCQPNEVDEILSQLKVREGTFDELLVIDHTGVKARPVIFEMN